LKKTGGQELFLRVKVMWCDVWVFIFDSPFGEQINVAKINVYFIEPVLANI
jgi:hypothetical protein